MDPEPDRGDERTDLEKDIEAWNLPRGPVLLAGPPLEHWPERRRGFEAELRALEDDPAA